MTRRGSIALRHRHPQPLEEQALTTAVTAAVHGRHTNYDELVAAGMDRDLARERVADRILEILAAWRN